MRTLIWFRNLRSIAASLAKLNIPLLIKTCDRFEDTPAIVLGVAKQHRCSTLFFNREYEFNESVRDNQTAGLFRANDLDARRFHDRVIVPPREIETKQGNFYSEKPRPKNDSNALLQKYPTTIELETFLRSKEPVSYRAIWPPE